MQHFILAFIEYKAIGHDMTPRPHFLDNFKIIYLHKECFSTEGEKGVLYYPTLRQVTSSYVS